MEKIKIIGREETYEIESIQQLSPTLLQIVFADKIPARYGDIELYTAGNILASTLRGWNTVYRVDGKSICLSNDGSVYQEPEPAPDPVPYVPTLEELQAAKKQEVSAACEQVIYLGVDVTLQNGTTEHFSLTEHDQLNLFGKQAQLVAGATELEYHADGKPCRYYSAADIQAIIQAAMQYVSYHTTYCNALNMWIAGCEVAENVQAIFYGADVPEEYRSEVLRAYLVEMANAAGGTDEAVF